MFRKYCQRVAVLSVIVAGIMFSGHLQADNRGEGLHQVTIDPDGTVHIPAMVVPPSNYMSEEAKRAYIDLRLHWPPDVRFWDDITQTRKAMDNHWLKPYLEKAKALYAVTVEEKTIAGVHTYVVMSKANVAKDDEGRVLINLHGGGFFVGAGTLQQIEAIPIAATAQIKVISIDFRQAPEYKFPAASEDVAAVYQELLKQYEPHNIGIYGTSTGGTLAAMALAWFEKMHLPRPGAIGLISAGIGGGDLLYMAMPLHPLWNSGNVPLAEHRPAYDTDYLAAADQKDPLVSPMLHPEVLGKFPPTLIISGTRDIFASGLFHIHRQLVKAGVEAQLQVWEGMWHGFNLDVDLPESKEMYEVTAKFFAAHLGKS